MARSAVITGGSGFIGRHLARELSLSGYSVAVYGPERPGDVELDHLLGDIRDVERLRHAFRQADVVFHLAGVVGTEYLINHTQEAVAVNILGSLNVYDIARDFGFSVVEAGVIPDWLSPYMITKKAAAKFGIMYHAQFGTDVRIIELSHVYGPGQRVAPYFKAIPTFLTRALRDQSLTVFGQGKRSMDCLYVRDAVKALKLVAECEAMAGNVVQFGTGSAITVLELAKKIIAMTNSKSKIDFAPMRRGEPDDSQEMPVDGVDLSCWRRLFDWEAQTSLDDGLMETISWYSLQLPERTTTERV